MFFYLVVSILDPSFLASKVTNVAPDMGPKTTAVSDGGYFVGILYEEQVVEHKADKEAKDWNQQPIQHRHCCCWYRNKILGMPWERCCCGGMIEAAAMSWLANDA